MSSILSWTEVTGRLEDNTPFCVAKEIAETFDLEVNNYHSLIKKINELKGWEIETSKELNTRDYQTLAQFINPRVNWPIKELKIAYDWYLAWTKSIIEHDSEYGRQTPSNPTSLNACMLFKLCKSWKIKVSRETTIKDMVTLIGLVQNQCTDGLIDIASDILSEIKSDEALIAIISNMMTIDRKYTETNENEKKNKKIEYNDLEKIFTRLSCVETLRSHYSITTNEEAIALAALEYFIDISSTQDPKKEYKLIKSIGRTNYIPYDRTIAYWWNRNRSILDLSCTFNPLFPISYYSEWILTKLTKRNGHQFVPSSSQECYEMLQIDSLMETFYEGEMPNLIKDTTLYLDDIDDIDNRELLSFGVFDQRMICITINELCDHLEYHGSFISPFEANSLLSTESIYKLKSIAKRKNYERLLELIERISHINQISDNPQVKKMIIRYMKGTDQDKQFIIRMLELVLHLGLHMRGWMGDPAPYTIDQTSVDPENVHTLHKMITEKMIEYKDLIADHPLALMIDRLPLLEYIGGSFQMSTKDDNGRTIGDRLRIVEEGEDTGINSCIRISSNWICSSAHRYLHALENRTRFDINKLTRIS